MLNNDTVIKVVNRRGEPYTVSLPNVPYYEWMPARNGIEHSHDLKLEEIQLIHTRSSTFRDGYLFIDNEEARQRLGLEKEDLKLKTLSREEIETMLKGNLNALKKLEKVKNDRALINEVIDVAKTIGIDNSRKLDYLSELSGIPVELIKPLEEE